MILTAETPDALVSFEWTINGTIIPENTQSIDVDVVEHVDTVSVRGLNDCGSWSLPLSLVWGDIPIEPIEPETNTMLFIILIIIIIVIATKVK